MTADEVIATSNDESMLIGKIMDLREQKAELLDALELILPMAKGYAAVNNVGSNENYISIASATIAKMKEVNP